MTLDFILFAPSGIIVSDGAESIPGIRERLFPIAILHILVDLKTRSRIPGIEIWGLDSTIPVLTTLRWINVT